MKYNGRLRWRAEYIDGVCDGGYAYNVYCRDFATVVVAANENQAIDLAKKKWREVCAR